MPHSIRESQKAFKIAWHGFALLGLIFAAMVFLSYQGFERAGTIRNLEAAIKNKQESIASLQVGLGTISKIQNEISQVKTNLDFMQTIISDPYKWSRLFAKLSQDFKNVNRIWIERIQSTPDGFAMIGKALSRDRIPALAAGLDGVSLERVTRIISEKGNVIYEFQLTAGLPPPPPEESSNDAAQAPQVGADKVSGSRGKIISAPKETVQVATAPPSATVKPQQPSTAVAEPKPAQASPVQPLEKGEVQEAAASAAEYYRRGIERIKAHNVQEALTEFESLVEHYPQSKYAPSSYYWIGECYYAMKNYHEAVVSFNQSLDYANNPKRAAGMLMLGISYQKLGQREEAVRQFEKLIEAYPEGEYTKTAKRKLQALAG
jgi:tol-pal system protein YbgF